eukprot:8895928-Alexandrium_andersonii.AAC.1
MCRLRHAARLTLEPPPSRPRWTGGLRASEEEKDSLPECGFADRGFLRVLCLPRGGRRTMAQHPPGAMPCRAEH